ncbi:MAG: divalent-cation tolerance protein CutA [Gemmatimonadetes bacterium]|nr:divalent-cation tolerance protein CutA [Gemmatimonadota bacterium]MBI3081574.1 divalent-cation tolerance protein CutA [Gemmatimonadota bacterium]
MTAGEFVVALTTLGNPAQARQLVQRLVDERLIACGTILPGATSVYRWQGRVTVADEVVVLLKTPRARWDALRAAVEAHHPYEVPELLALPVVAGLERYLDWVTSETS